MTILNCFAKDLGQQSSDGPIPILYTLSSSSLYQIIDDTQYLPVSGLIQIHSKNHNEPFRFQEIVFLAYHWSHFVRIIEQLRHILTVFSDINFVIIGCDGQ